MPIGIRLGSHKPKEGGVFCQHHVLSRVIEPAGAQKGFATFSQCQSVHTLNYACCLGLPLGLVRACRLGLVKV